MARIHLPGALRSTFRPDYIEAGQALPALFRRTGTSEEVFRLAQAKTDGDSELLKLATLFQRLSASPRDR